MTEGTAALPTREEILQRIRIAKEKLGKDLIILAHLYQHDDIVRYADFIGDSLQLAQTASKQKDAKYIVFCAVTFMAEMARILCLPEQKVFHPEPAAKCPLAEMASGSEVEAAWSVLKKTGRKIIPVVYVNSRGDLKAFCGRNGGYVCTSANAKKIMKHVLDDGAVPFFFPDENLGRNTAHTLGIDDSEMYLWEPTENSQEIDKTAIKTAKVLLWRGFCYVHMLFKTADVEAAKQAYGDDINIIVHPECTSDVVRLSQYVGSTSYIKRTIEEAKAGTKWAIGTEINFVNRVKRENPDKFIVPLKEWACREMAKITGLRLAGILESLVDGKLPSEVAVDPETARYAKIALDRMLEIS